jgi:N-acetylmuramoyl-L-alanine amidase
VSNLKVRDRGYKFKKFSVLSHTLCPAVLVECGFISNSYERSRCKTSSYQAAAARAIVSGVERYDRTY